MKYLVQFLDGKKTYLVALAYGVLSLVMYLQAPDPTLVDELILQLLQGGGLAALRLGVSK